MTLLVKICGITDERAADAAVACGADAVGFVFAPSVRRLTPSRARKIAARVPSHVRRVAVMLHPGADEWHDVQQGFRPDVLQTDREDYAALDVDDGIERWPVYREGLMTADADWPEVFVYEGPKSGAGETVDWKTAAGIAKKGRMILAGGLAVDNVADAIETVHPYGVDVSSAVESQPGVKDPDLVAAFISAARGAREV